MAILERWQLARPWTRRLPPWPATSPPATSTLTFLFRWCHPSDGNGNGENNVEILSGVLRASSWWKAATPCQLLPHPPTPWLKISSWYMNYKWELYQLSTTLNIWLEQRKRSSRRWKHESTKSILIHFRTSRERVSPRMVSPWVSPTASPSSISGGRRTLFTGISRIQDDWFKNRYRYKVWKRWEDFERGAN